MSVESDVFDVLTNDAGIDAIVADQVDNAEAVFAISFPQNVELPAITFFRNATSPETYLDRTVDTLVNARFEVISWALDYNTAKNLAAAVRAAMVGADAFRAVWLNEADQYSHTPECYFVVQEFSIWSREGN